MTNHRKTAIFNIKLNIQLDIFAITATQALLKFSCKKKIRQNKIYLLPLILILILLSIYHLHYISISNCCSSSGTVQYKLINTKQTV